VVLIVALSVREWSLLLARRKPAALRETEPVWLPGYAVAEARPFRWLGVLALGLGLAKELSGEAELERAQRAAASCDCHQAGISSERGKLYLEVTERRYRTVRRCC
jgi:hypothetical protein